MFSLKRCKDKPPALPDAMDIMNRLLKWRILSGNLGRRKHWQPIVGSEQVFLLKEQAVSLHCPVASPRGRISGGSQLPAAVLRVWLEAQLMKEEECPHRGGERRVSQAGKENTCKGPVVGRREAHGQRKPRSSRQQETGWPSSQGPATEGSLPEQKMTNKQ